MRVESKERQKEMDNAENWFEEYWTDLINSHRPVDYVLLEYAEEKNINLIVTGTRGRNTMQRLVLGSVASRVVTYAHCPLLLVK